MFIVFEGLDGSGQSTQAEMLKTYLENKKGKKVFLTKEPSRNVLGKLAKSTLKGRHKMPLLALEFLFVADRALHLKEEIEPALKKGEIVLCDRYFFSTIAFGGLDADKKFLKEINSKFRVPDIIFLLDCPPEVCLGRLAKREGTGKLELFEKKEKMEKVRQNYLALSKEYKSFNVIDGNRPKEEVFKEIKKIVDENLRVKS